MHDFQLLTYFHDPQRSILGSLRYLLKSLDWVHVYVFVFQDSLKTHLDAVGSTLLVSLGYDGILYSVMMDLLLLCNFTGKYILRGYDRALLITPYYLTPVHKA